MKKLLSLIALAGLVVFGAKADYYSLVKNASDLAAGDKVVIVATDANVAMSTTQNTNNPMDEAADDLEPSMPAQQSIFWSTKFTAAQEYPIYTAVAKTVEEEDWTPAFMTDKAIEVYVFKNSILLHGWAGNPDYSMVVEYEMVEDEEYGEYGVVTNLELYNHEKLEAEGASGYVAGYTGNADYYYANFYLADDYAYAESDNDDKSGYVTIGAYFYKDENDNGTWMYYNVAWENGSGVAVVATDNMAPVELYNLQGVKIANPKAGQIYIRVQGNKASKVLIK